MENTTLTLIKLALDIPPLNLYSLINSYPVLTLQSYHILSSFPLWSWVPPSLGQLNSLFCSAYCEHFVFFQIWMLLRTLSLESAYYFSATYTLFLILWRTNVCFHRFNGISTFSTFTTSVIWYANSIQGFPWIQVEVDELFPYYTVCKVTIYFSHTNPIIFTTHFSENKTMTCLLFYHGFLNRELRYSCSDDYKLFRNTNKNVLLVTKSYKFWYFASDLMIR